MRSSSGCAQYRLLTAAPAATANISVNPRVIVGGTGAVDDAGGSPGGCGWSPAGSRGAVMVSMLAWTRLAATYAEDPSERPEEAATPRAVSGPRSWEPALGRRRQRGRRPRRSVAR